MTTDDLQLSVEREMAAAPAALWRAWTTGFGDWFAAPDSVAMEPRVGAPFFFEVAQPLDGGLVRRHPHYGRFLRLEPYRLVELTWVTGPDGTRGAETVVTVELAPRDTGTLLRLTHARFRHAEARDAHARAWPFVLEQLDRRLGA